VADDEPAIRLAVTRYLTRRGWEVVTAPDAVDAVRALREGGPWDVLLLDVNLGPDDGVALHAGLTGDLARRTLFMTGDAADPRISFTGCPAIAKPFEFADLVAALDAIAPPP
jgi:DNA-binding response OmpR family regulator